MSESRGLGGSARAAMLWGGGFTFLCDIAQFFVMLLMVRLLAPSDYGTMALAQSILGLLSVVSFATFSMHALQVRDPSRIDWQAHFTAAAAMNAFVFALTLVVAAGLSFSGLYHEAALPLAALGLVFIVEVPGTLRHRMLESAHDWKRYRVLLIIGTLAALGAGAVVALLGGGVWALVLQVPMLALPGAIDLFLNARFRPDWSWSRERYDETLRFGVARMGSAVLVRARPLAEQMVLASAFDLATLGMFTRAVGLATLLAGRIGSVAMMSLYPVITRAEKRSDRFRRLSSLVLRGVCWTTAPAAAFMGVVAGDIVSLLYGDRWVAVTPLLPYAAAMVGLGGVTTALSSLLLANDEARACLRIDFIATVSGIALSLGLVPFGAPVYLAALCVQSLLVTGVAVSLQLRHRGVDREGIVSALAPAGVAVVVAVAAVEGVSAAAGSIPYLAVRLAVDGIVFGVVYVAVLRAAFAAPLAEMLEVLPGGHLMARGLLLQ